MHMVLWSCFRYCGHLKRKKTHNSLLLLNLIPVTVVIKVASYYSFSYLLHHLVSGLFPSAPSFQENYFVVS